MRTHLPFGAVSTIDQTSSLYRTRHLEAIGRPNQLTTKATLLAAFGFVFLAFFPNPALPISDQAGLQFNQLLAFALIPWILMRRPPLIHVAVVAALMAMVVVCSFISLIADASSLADLSAKMLIVILIAVVVIIPAGYFAERANLHAILLAASIAVLVHTMIGLYQILSFQNSIFPLPWIFNNPSFASMADDAETYALYVRRPFGLFPEPSAMGASLGPWLIILLGLVLRGSYSWTQRRGIFLVTVVTLLAGVFLMFQARSGYMALWLACLIPVIVYYGLASAQPGFSRIIRVYAGTLIGIVGVVIAWNYLSSSLNQETVASNSSWASRQQSLVIAFTAPAGDPIKFLFGFGPGQAPTYLQSNTSANLLPYWYSASETFEIDTVWSVLGTLYMENGLIAVIVIGGILTAAVRSIWRSSARVLGLSVLAAWLLGVTIATSYFPLSPIWICLAMLLVWDKLFDGAIDAAEEHDRELLATARTPLHPWQDRTRS